MIDARARTSIPTSPGFATPRISRLVGLAAGVADLVLHVDHLPDPGGDVLATSSQLRAGGGIHALRSAADAGLPVAYAGAHGTGPFGDVVRAALADFDAQVLLDPAPAQDTGVCVVLVDSTGERTFATTVGAEGHLTESLLDRIVLAPGDAIYVSGYDLAYPHGAVMAGYVDNLPQSTPLVLDPGPLVAELHPDLLRRVLARTTWLSLNAREQQQLAKVIGGAAATTGARTAGVVVRDGPAGAWLHEVGRVPVRVAGVPVEDVLDTNGAGDVHVGAFVAALARGLEPVEAVAAANRAAAAHVSRHP